MSYKTAFFGGNFIVQIFFLHILNHIFAVTKHKQI